MKVQRLKDDKVVIQEELDEEYLLRDSMMSYSILAPYTEYVFASIHFDNVLFIWPSQRQLNGKSKGQQAVNKSYAGFVVGNLVHIKLEMSDASALDVEFIVAERNQIKEQKKGELQDIVIGTPRVKEVHCLMPKKYAQQLSETEKYPILHVSRVPSMVSYESILAITSLLHEMK